MSFRHVYFSKEKRGAKPDTDAKEAFAALSKPGVPDETFGDSYLQDLEFSDHDEQDLITVWKDPDFDPKLRAFY